MINWSIFALQLHCRYQIQFYSKYKLKATMGGGHVNIPNTFTYTNVVQNMERVLDGEDQGEGEGYWSEKNGEIM